MVIKAADIGHSAVCWPQHEQWSLRVAAEFFAQGEHEKALGMPMSPLCDKAEAPNIGSSQKGFLEFVCMPLFEVLAKLEEDLEEKQVLRENPLAEMAGNCASWKDYEGGSALEKISGVAAKYGVTIPLFGMPLGEPSAD